MLADMTFAVIGGGACGTGTIAEMAHIYLPSNGPPALRGQWFEGVPAQRYGGVAFSPSVAGVYPGYATNVPAIAMSAINNDRSHLRRWVRHAGHSLFTDTAIERALYSQYLKELYQARRRAAPNGTRIGQRAQKIVDIEFDQDQQATLYTECGKTYRAGHVVLTTGHHETIQPHFTAAVQGHPSYLASPWGQKAEEKMAAMKPDAPVLIVGTALSGCDTAMNLLAKGHKNIVMMSRHGLMHPVGRPARKKGHYIFPYDILNARSIPELEQAIKKQWKKARARLYPPQQILESWEVYAPQVINNLINRDGVGKEEIAALMKKHKSLIATNRVGMAETTGMAVMQGIADGHIKVWCGSINEMKPSRDGKKIKVDMSRRDQSGTFQREVFEFHDVIVALGQNNDVTLTSDPLWQNMLRRGYVQPHWTGIGIDVGPDGAVLQNGQANYPLTAVGPMCAGRRMVTSDYDPIRAEYTGRIGPTAGSMQEFSTKFNPAATRVLRQLAKRPNRVVAPQPF